MSREKVNQPEYEAELKLAAVRRVLAGESVSAVAEELGIRRNRLVAHSNQFSENDSVKYSYRYPHNEPRVVWATLAHSLLASDIFEIYLPNL